MPTKAPVTSSQHQKILARYAWLRDDDARLKHAAASGNHRACHLQLRRLAQLRDHFRQQARRIASPPPGSRAALAMATAGSSELARLIARRPLMRHRREAAQRNVQYADAADMLLRYWGRRFQAAALRAKEQADRRPVQDLRQLPAIELLAAFSQAAEADESSSRFTPDPATLDITATVAEVEQADPEPSAYQAALRPGSMQIAATPHKGASLKPRGASLRRTTSLRYGDGLLGLSPGEALGSAAVGALAGLLL